MQDSNRLLGHARQMIFSADAMLTRFAVDEVKGRVRFDSLEDFATKYLPEPLGLFAKGASFCGIAGDVSVDAALGRGIQGGRVGFDCGQARPSDAL